MNSDEDENWVYDQEFLENYNTLHQYQKQQSE